jgi:hypothetical protein
VFRYPSVLAAATRGSTAALSGPIRDGHHARSPSGERRPAAIVDEHQSPERVARRKPVDLYELAREDRPEVPIDRGEARSDALEVGGLQDGGLDLRRGADGAGRGFVREQRHLAEDRARDGAADAMLDAVPVRDEDVRRAALDEHEAMRAIAGRNQHRSGLELLPPQPIELLTKLGGGQAVEDRTTPSPNSHEARIQPSS